MADDDLDFGATVRGMATGQKVFNRYTLQKILGRGGMGVVWLAHDDELERDIAMKFLPEIVALDKQSIRDLKRETRRSLDLTHPHIIRIYDFVQDATSAAISMEFVAGDTLGSLKADTGPGRFEVSEIQTWVKHLCEALEYAHTKAQVVHRDLKPANLMIDAAGDLKIADFGIAANISDSVSRVSQQAGSSGTPVYMSPQQMMGEPPAVTDDIYALGATLYDLLTGKPPFYSGNVMMQVMNKQPEGLAARRQLLETTGTEIPAAWEETIMACLAKEADQRPESAGEVWQRLNGAGGAGAVEGLKSKVESPAPARTPHEPAPSEAPISPPSTNPAPTTAQTTSSGGKKSVLPLVMGLVAFIVLVGGGGAFWLWTALVPTGDSRDLAEIMDVTGRDYLIDNMALGNSLSADLEATERDTLAPDDFDGFEVPDLAGMRLVPIPQGEFTLGSAGEVAYWSKDKQPGDEEGRDRDEGPQTEVSIPLPYLLGQSEVTNAQWLILMRDKMSAEAIANAEANPDHPAVNLTWTEAMEFGERLTARERAAGRLPEEMVYTLPTEAEWEYACRAGTTTPYAGDMTAMAWYEGNSGDRAHPVMQKRPNAWGLYDMHGNVWERVWDNYGDYPGGTVEDWTGSDEDANNRVFRGGSFEDSARLQRSAYRGRYIHWDRRDVVGFRIALVTPGGIGNRRDRVWDGYVSSGRQLIQDKLEMIGAAADRYMREKGETEVSIGALLATTLERDTDWLRDTYLGESYFALNPLKKNKTLEVKTKDGETITYDPW